MTILRQFTFVLSAAVLGGCAAERQPGDLFGPHETGVPVVDGFLLVGQPLPDLFVRRSADPAEEYRLETVSVNDAEVILSTGVAEYHYQPDPDSAGRYLPPPGKPLVAPLTLYRLHVQLSGGDQVHGKTHTPAQLRIEEAVLLDDAELTPKRSLALFAEGGEVFIEPRNQIEYLDGILEVAFSPVSGTAAYQLAVFSLDLESEFIIDADFLEKDDSEDFERRGSSPPLEIADGRARLPWFAIAYAGRHVMHVYGLDANWYDLVRTMPEGEFFGGLAGDSFQRPLFRLQGGIGLFGSASVDSVGFVILPRP
ncbi:MAG: hypothetical protein VX733_08160 [Candidatus Latescibacterota bacterium]|nr:hypothetical protein [Candidatus Latescibacterota bacterium]